MTECSDKVRTSMAGLSLLGWRRHRNGIADGEASCLPQGGSIWLHKDELVKPVVLGKF